MAPVTDRGGVIGLLEMVLPDEPAGPALGKIARTAHALAFMVIANRRHTRGQRSTPFTLPAEIQRRLLPASFTTRSGPARRCPTDYAPEGLSTDGTSASATCPSS